MKPSKVTATQLFFSGDDGRLLSFMKEHRDRFPNCGVMTSFIRTMKAKKKERPNASR